MRRVRFWPNVAADVDDEMAFHREMLVRDYVARGMSEPEARAAALRRLGNVRAARDACIDITTKRERRMTRALLVDAFAQDVRFALRSLARQPGWTAVAVLTLALGIGATSAVFSVVNRLLLQPLPYPDASRVAIVYQEPSQGNTTGTNVIITPPAPVVKAWQEATRSFEQLEGYRTETVTLAGPGAAAVAQASYISPRFPRFAGERALVGRVFSEAEVREKAPVAVLSEGMWRERFGADPAVIGRALLVDDTPRTIVGVLPASLQLPRVFDEATDIWLPLDPGDRSVGLLVVGRLRPGFTLDAAARELDAITEHSGVVRDGGALAHRTKLAGPGAMVSFRESLILLAIAVGLVLLIACANVAHLLLARASARRRELAIRAARGAGRGRLFRPLLTESLLLSLAGCAGGLAVGWAALKALVAMRPPTLNELAAARVDGDTLLVTTLVAVLTGIGFGVIGAAQAGRHSTHDALKAGAGTVSHGQRQGRLRSLLVVTEMALSTMLLVGATLLLRSMMHLQSTDPGFDAANLYAVSVPLPPARYQTPAARGEFYAELARRARLVPGVRAVTVTGGPIPSRSFRIGALQVEGEPDPPAGTTAFINYAAVGPEYFRVVGTRLLEGDTFSDTTAAGAQVIVNEGLARRHWPGTSALGKRLRIVFNGQGAWWTIVGVVQNAATGGLLADASEPMLYLPGGERYMPAALVRTSGAEGAVAGLTAMAAAIDPRLPPPAVRAVEEGMRRSIARPRFTMLLLTVFTAVALGLAAVGLYGVLAYAVAQRTREIGIRMALGASRRAVAWSVLSRGLALAVVGAAAGLLAARWGAALLGSMLHGVGQTDALSFAAAALVLVATAAVACAVPAGRAVGVDPLIAMKAE